jgi:hypothetical protein
VRDETLWIYKVRIGLENRVRLLEGEERRRRERK